MKIKSILFVITAILIGGQLTMQAQHMPSFEEVISLKSISNPEISPDGNHVLFQKSTIDWEENRYDTEIWISKNGETPFQLTNHAKTSSNNPKWSPDGKWIAFVSARNEKNQIYVINTSGGEAFQVTHTNGGVNDYEWSPDGSKLAFIQGEDLAKSREKRKEKYGSFAIEDGEYSKNQLWMIDFLPDQLNRAPLPAEMDDSTYTKTFEASLLLDSAMFTINDFKWSPDGMHLALEHQPDPLINTFFKADISIVDTESKKLTTLVNNPSYDGLVDWSPDGKSILYQSSLKDTVSNYYRNGKLFRIDTDGSNNIALGEDFDENFSRLVWNDSGIYGVAWQQTSRPIVRIDPGNGRTAIVNIGPDRVWDLSFAKDGTRLAYSGSGDNELTELYLVDFMPENSPESNPASRVTHLTSQIESWSAASSEVVSWQSKDGTTIEGVLHKPQDYDPEKKYPLMVIIHGGPTGISVPGPAPSYVYPIIQWLNKGALVLRPNYRGSAGYGEAFRSLNVRNLGVGDAWDVLSGVEHLIDEGIVHPDSTAAMGWSQGGYISAFLTTSSDQFRAVSVGAGISNWMTYYVNTDIHPFTRQYLKATPWSDKDIYEFTSPMTHINQASTPTLIQHGEFDRRVPPANAFELFQGLQDVGVDTKLIIYKGFGHGINKPKERLAATWHNWQWMGKYVWGEDIEIPEE